MNTKEKILGTTDDDQKKRIVVTHVTIRQSISVLLLRLIMLEVIAAIAVILLHTLVVSTGITDIVKGLIPFTIVFNVPIFILLILLKNCLMIFIIVQWLNEYYEITTEEIIHKKGLIFKKEERNTLEHMGSLEVTQSILGKVFNFGTIKLFNWAKEVNVYFYLIHNPMKYHHILETILPEADKEKKMIREHLIEPEKI
jgi:membrane protein YdbS with pleckstrin-like domain